MSSDGKLKDVVYIHNTESRCNMDTEITPIFDLVALYSGTVFHEN